MFFHRALNILELEKNKIALVCIADKKYLGYAKVLLRSLLKSKNDFDIHICLINISRKAITRKSLELINANVNIKFLDKKFRRNWLKKAFCANHRAEFIYEILQYNYEGIIYADVDSIFRSSISKDKILSTTSDIKIHFRDQNKTNDDRFNVAGGVIFIKNSTNAKKFIGTWAENLKSRKLEWFADQILFYKTYEQLKTNVNVEHLSNDFIDWEFNKNSSIWSGKGTRKKYNFIYNLESLKLRLANPVAQKIIIYLENLYWKYQS